MVQKALFLDRDGVINVDYGYVYKISNFKFHRGIFRLASKAVNKGYHIIVVTNQAGIARGYYNESDFLKLSNWMCGEFQKNECPILKVYFAPTHPTEGKGKYKMLDYRRKPNPGMILEAACEFNLDLDDSIMIGDKHTDIEAGLSAGVGCNILLGDSNKVATLDDNVKVVSSLKQAELYL